MTRGLAASAANSILNVYRNTAYAAVATPFIQLHTADPGAAGTTAVSGGSNVRNAIVWSASSGGSMALSTLSAWTNGGVSETVTDTSIWTASTVGTFLQSCPLSVSQAWVSTNTLTITTFTLSYTPIAA
jgi:Tfp pilus assembly protein FimT